VIALSGLVMPEVTTGNSDTKTGRLIVRALGQKANNKNNEHKMKNSLISITAAALGFLAAAGSASSGTLDVYVDPTTWAISSPPNPAAGDAVDGYDIQASHQDQYGVWHYRYYTFGRFGAVNIWNNNNKTQLLWSSGSGGCNNIFYIDRSVATAYVCSTGYNGTGNGTSGEVQYGSSLSNGDFLIGGQFASAGGYEYTSSFSCYQWDNGWSGVNGIMLAGGRGPDGWGFNGVYQLHVITGPTTVWGPTTSGGPRQTIGVPLGSSAYWNEYHYSFAAGWWIVQSP